MIKAPTLTIEKYRKDRCSSMSLEEAAYVQANIGKPLGIYEITYLDGELWNVAVDFGEDKLIIFYPREITGTIDFDGQYQIKIGEDK